MMRSCWLFALAIVAVVPAAVHAQTGGVVELHCDDENVCTDDTFFVSFESGSSTYEGPLVPGTIVPVAVEMDVVREDVNSWSFSIWHDERRLRLLPDRLTMLDTVLDPEFPDGLGFSPLFQLVEVSESGFFSQVVLDLDAKVVLPVGRLLVARAAYQIVKDAECSSIQLTDWLRGRRRRIQTNGNSVPRRIVHAVLSDRVCQEICLDGIDNDGNGDTDCEDSQCDAYYGCEIEFCDDGVDNDGDGLVDCGDPDCDGDTLCRFTPRERCFGGADEDRDGLIDCEDPDCARSTFCLPPEDCEDGVDNDLDGVADCEDSDCTAVCEEDCTDGIDNDADRRIDCVDSECEGFPACPEICGDGIDNDFDGKLDCADLNCADDVSCPVSHAGRGGFVEDFCSRPGWTGCSDDTLEIVFDNDRSTLRVGETPQSIPIRVVTETRSRHVEGWSFAALHDRLPGIFELLPDSVTTDGTMADPNVAGAVARAPNFNVTQVVSGGFISAVVLSFLEDTELPVGERNAICRAEYSLRSALDRPAVIELVSGEIGPASPFFTPPTDINFTIQGRAYRPSLLYHGLILPTGAPTEICEDGVDNDGDGRIDCEDSDCSDQGACRVPLFRRGDANGDGRINVSDVIPLIRTVLGIRTPDYDCEAALDVNDDGGVNLSDVIPLMQWLFLDGPYIAGPFRGCGSRGVCLESSSGCST
ncbi:MAG: dockerin type I repeat-containing protein [Planctomycetota bacterium]